MGRRARSAAEVLWVFLRLGLTSFGGPVAHLGYFRAELVERRGWLDERAYADLVGLCQFLPGPASSQVGFAVGLLRGGWLGGMAAWLGFTLPSAVLMTAFAFGAGGLVDWPWGAGLLHALKLAAVAVVAQAVWGMARSLCPDRVRASIAVVAVLIVVSAPVAVGQVGAIVVGAVAGVVFCRGGGGGEAGGLVGVPVSRGVGVMCLGVVGGLLVGLPLLRGLGWGVFEAYFRSGALVFGGGHVVLPLLRDAVVGPGWVSDGAFLAGYGAAQAMPGPLFSFAAYLGAVGRPGGVGGAVLATVAIFLPGLLLVAGVLPFWAGLRGVGGVRAGLLGVNAAVVGVLGAAFYSPVFLGAVFGGVDFGVALAGVVLLVGWRVSPVWVVGGMAGWGVVEGWLFSLGGGGVVGGAALFHPTSWVRFLV